MVCYDDYLTIDNYKRLSVSNDIKITNPFFKNKFFIGSGINEKKIVEDARAVAFVERNQTLNLTIKPTISCNLDCIYCWQKDESGFMNEGTIENVLKFIDNKVKTVKKLVINWFGGEPMLAYDIIISMMERVGTICRNNHIPYLGLMSTNGTLLTSEKMNVLLKHHIYSFQVTLDGTKELHDRCRPAKNPVISSYDLITKNLINIRDAVKQKYLEIIVRVNVTKDFLKNKEDFIRFYKANFLCDKRFSLLLEDVTDKSMWRRNLSL
jgi:uncharacterized protein